MALPPPPTVLDSPEDQQLLSEGWTLLLGAQNEAASKRLQPLLQRWPSALPLALSVRLAQGRVDLRPLVEAALLRLELAAEDYAEYIAQGQLPNRLPYDPNDEDWERAEKESLRADLMRMYDEAFDRASTLEKLLLLAHEVVPDDARIERCLAGVTGFFELALLTKVTPLRSRFRTSLPERLADAFPEVAYSLWVLAVTYSQDGAREKFLATAEQGRKTQNPVPFLSWLAVRAETEARSRDVVALCEELLGHAPQDTAARRMLAFARASLGEPTSLDALTDEGVGRGDRAELEALLRHLGYHGLAGRAVELHLRAWPEKTSREELYERYELWTTPFPAAWHEHLQREEARLAASQVPSDPLALYRVRASRAAELARTGDATLARELLPLAPDQSLREQLQVAIAEHERDVAGLAERFKRDRLNSFRALRGIDVYARMNALEEVHACIHAAAAQPSVGLDQAARLESWRAWLAMKQGNAEAASGAVATFFKWWPLADPGHAATRRVRAVQSVLARDDAWKVRERETLARVVDGLLADGHIVLVEPTTQSRTSLLDGLLTELAWDDVFDPRKRGAWLAARLLEHDAVEDVFTDDDELATAAASRWPVP